MQDIFCSVPLQDGSFAALARSWNLHILEFTRTPASFFRALAENETLAACTATLEAAGLDVSGRVKIFADPHQYAAAAPHAEGLRMRHVLASERYVEAVLTAVHGIPGRDNVAFGLPSRIPFKEAGECVCSVGINGC